MGGWEGTWMLGWGCSAGVRSSTKPRCAGIWSYQGHLAPMPFFCVFFLALYALVLGVTNWNPVAKETLLHSCAAHGGSEQQASSLVETSSQAETSSCSRLVLTVLRALPATRSQQRVIFRDQKHQSPRRPHGCSRLLSLPPLRLAAVHKHRAAHAPEPPWCRTS